MLADLPTSSGIGTLQPGVHQPGASRLALLEFIAAELPRWRDRPQRPTCTAETALTAQLCAHLNTAARDRGWDCYQFRTEVPDESRGNRAIDLAASPACEELWVEGRSYCDFDIVLPIECKRLPTPAGHGRDEREYVCTATGSAGGIQRFKEGHHAAAHGVAGMIAYLQLGSHDECYRKVHGWIAELATSAGPLWSHADQLEPLAHHVDTRLRTYRSRHARRGNLPDIDLHHLWLGMS